jgi:hypothetical protein
VPATMHASAEVRSVVSSVPVRPTSVPFIPALVMRDSQFCNAISQK